MKAVSLMTFAMISLAIFEFTSTTALAITAGEYLCKNGELGGFSHLEPVAGRQVCHCSGSISGYEGGGGARFCSYCTTYVVLCCPEDGEPSQCTYGGSIERCGPEHVVGRCGL